MNIGGEVIVGTVVSAPKGSGTIAVDVGGGRVLRNVHVGSNSQFYAGQRVILTRSDATQAWVAIAATSGLSRTSAVEAGDGREDITNLLYAPTNVRTRTGVGSIIVLWDGYPGVYVYEVQRNTTASEDGNEALVFVSRGSVFVDTDVVAGTTYYYRVRSVMVDTANGVARASGWSSWVSGVASETSTSGDTWGTGYPASTGKWVHIGDIPNDAVNYGWSIANCYGLHLQWDTDVGIFALQDNGADRKDLVIGWGDNPSGTGVEDYLRFVFLRTGSAAEDVARFTPDHHFEMVGGGNIVFPDNTHRMGKIKLWQEADPNVVSHAIGTEQYYNTYGPSAGLSWSIGHKFYTHNGLLAAQIGVGADPAPSNHQDSYFYGLLRAEGGARVSNGIGVNGDRDTQFVADFHGPVRVGGPLAAKPGYKLDALMICRFDGPGPYQTDFTGDAHGHKGQVPAVSGGVIFRPGKFGKAVQIAEATTNYIKNPSFEVSVTDYWQLASSDGSATRAQDSSKSVYGQYSCKLNRGTATGYAFIASDSQGATLTLLDGESATASVWVYVESGYVSIAIWEGTTRRSGYVSSSATGRWERLIVSYTNNSGASQNLHVRVHFNSAVGDCWVDAVQFEKKSYPTPYCDGSLGSGHSWSGAAHASASQREAARITYPSDGNVSADRGTVMMWIANSSDSGIQAGVQPGIWRWWDGWNSDSLYLYFSDDKSMVYFQSYSGGVANPIPSASINWNSGDWHHVAITWDGDNGVASLYIDGQLQDSKSSWSAPSISAPDMYIGEQVSLRILNGWIDDLVILDRALSADEIRAVYESRVPVEDYTFVSRPISQYGHGADFLFWSYEGNSTTQILPPGSISKMFSVVYTTRKSDGSTIAAGPVSKGRPGSGYSSATIDTGSSVGEYTVRVYSDGSLELYHDTSIANNDIQTGLIITYI